MDKEIFDDNDEKLWQRAISINSIIFFKKYLMDMPNGKYKEIALDKIAILQDEINKIEEQEWHEALTQNKYYVFLNFKKKYPSSQYVKEALLKLQELESFRDIEDGTLILCNSCKEYKSNIKQFKLISSLLFFGVGAIFKSVKSTCCSSCMRKTILKNTFDLKILTGNILWLILIIPWNLVLVLLTYLDGHSSSYLLQIEKDKIIEIENEKKKLGNVELNKSQIKQKAEFKERMEKLDDLKLLKIIKLSNEYQPLAVSAAMEEALKRNLIDEQGNLK